MPAAVRQADVSLRRIAIGVSLAATGAAQAFDWRLAAGHGVVGNQMVYDSVRDRFVAFADGICRQDDRTVEWDGLVWRTRATAHAPSSRQEFGLAWDPVRGRVVLFGGVTVTASPAVRFDDTWEYDGIDWHQLTPAVHPSVRSAPGMAFDPVLGEVVLAGGEPTSSSTVVDTWTWNGARWQSHPAACPPLIHKVMAAHPSTGRLVLVGNSAGSIETWTFDGVSWLQAAVPQPASGYNYRMATDLSGDRIVMLVSNSLTPWVWNGTGWSQMPAAFDGRISSGLAADATGRVLAFGGMTTSGFATRELNDLWQLADAGHVRVDEGGPLEVAGTEVAWDSWRGRLVNVGPASPSSLTNQTWEYDGVAWHGVAATQPTPTIDARVCFDPLRGRTVRFGGGRLGFLVLVPTSELSEWDGVQWHVSNVFGPPARRLHAMAFDLVHGGVIVFGGLGASGALGDTWAWDGASWTQLAAVGPSPRTEPGLAADIVRGRLVLFGGLGGASLSTNLADTWEWDGTLWQQRTTVTVPPARRNPQMEYDLSQARTLMFWGLGPTAVTADQWTWDGTDWRQLAPTMAGGSAIVSMALTGDGRALMVSQGSTWVGFPSIANTVTEGTACGGAFVPQLRAEGAPSLGTTDYVVALQDAAPLAPFALAVGFGRGSSLPIGGGCTFYLPQIDLLTPAFGNASGYGQMRLSVPMSPPLLGLEVSLQAGVLDGSGPLGIALTNGLVARVGW